MLSSRLLERQFAFALPAQAALILLVERGESGPIVSADEKQQERDRGKIDGLNSERHHENEIAANGQLGVGQPAAAAPVLRVFDFYLTVADRVFRSAGEAGLNAKQSFDHGLRVDH